MLRDDALEVLRALEAKGRLRGRREFQGKMQMQLVLEGGAVHNFSSNDYLGLAGDVRLVEAVACGELGYGAGASRLIASPEVHGVLERELARWLGTEGALLFNSGYAANTGVISALGGAEATVFSDELNHASIIDGCRLSRSRVVVFRHLQYEELEQQLREDRSRRKLIISESVFSMDGDVADVAVLRGLADRWGAALIIDEAHAVGARGPGGRGVCAERGVRPELLVGTLGKAFGCYGAFVAGEEPVMAWLWNRARSLVFSTGLPGALSLAALAALRIVEGEEGEQRRSELRSNVALLGAELGRSLLSHIVPVVVGGDREATRLSSELLARGFFVQAIRPPTVPEGAARLRIALGLHTPSVVVELAKALAVTATSRG